jgi:hypothetical protein
VRAVTPSPVVLPRAATLTDTLLAPADALVSEIDRRSARNRLQEGLGEPASTRTGGRVRVDGYLVRSHHEAARAQAMIPGPFEWSARGARRTLGLAAVRLCLADHRAPADAVREVMRSTRRGASEDRDRAGSLGRWLSTLPRGARDAVLVEAVTWVTSLYCSLAWDRLGADAEVGGSDRWWNCPSAPRVGVRGRAEVRVPVGAGGPPAPTSRCPDQGLALFSVMTGWPGPTSRAELGVNALAHALVPGLPAPARIVGWWPQAGRALALSVDRTLLEQGVDTVLRVVGSVPRTRPALPAA